MPVKVLYIECEHDTVLKLLALPSESQVCNCNCLILRVIADFKPDVIVSMGSYPMALSVAPLEIRKRWINFQPNASPEEIQRGIEYCYANNLWRPEAKDYPLITVYTAAYNSGEWLRETFESLQDQFYTNFEWVVVDDGSTNDTYERLLRFAKQDSRVRPFSMPHSGKIGEVKGLATRLAYGSLLVELDHDDLLIDTALSEIKMAFDTPNVGMCYSNCAEFYSDGRPDNEYKDDFWKNRYRSISYQGRVYREARSPAIYGRWGQNYFERNAWFLTAGPNHVRAYRRSELERLGGYNTRLDVADDWDVFYRFFLYSRCHHIDKLLYLQRFSDTTVTKTRNKSIQEHLELCRLHYTDLAMTIGETRPSLDNRNLDLTNPDWNSV